LATESSDEKRAVVIGAGLGGLLGAAVLLRHGWAPLVLERLDFYGGKFTGFDYRGYQVPSGAFHALPAGQAGSLAQALRRAGVPVRCIAADPPFVVLSAERRYRLPLPPWPHLLARDSLAWRLPRRSIGGFIRTYLALGYGPLPSPEMSLEEFARRHTDDGQLIGALDRLLRFTNGTPLAESSALDVAVAFRQHRGRFEGVLVGGCRAVTESLVALIRRQGGALRNRCPVERIVVEGGRVAGVVAQEEFIAARLVLSGAGPHVTAELLGPACPSWLARKVQETRPAWGIAYAFGSPRPVLPHSGIEFPLQSRYIAGYVELTRSAPALAPPGGHLLMAYQCLGQDEDVGAALGGGQEELNHLLGLGSEQLLNVAVYRGHWPAAFTQQRLGQSGTERYPLAVAGVEGLYMLGHDSAGHGFAAEIIGDAALALDGLLRSPHFIGGPASQS
jgi:glycine/D-amino acid oxidase-like deaminating enzyme